MDKLNDSDKPFKKRSTSSYSEASNTSKPSEGSSSIITDNTDDVNVPNKKVKSYDFAFSMKPVKVLNNAIQALSDDKLNPRQEAVIQVDKGGCEIVVWTYNLATGHDGFGYLGLKASGLSDFQCKKPFRKAFSVTGIAKMFKAAAKFEEESVLVFVEEGSDNLCFQFGGKSDSTVLDFGFGVPIPVPLVNVLPTINDFPKCHNYGFEAVLPSSVFRRLSKILKMPRKFRPETVEVTLQTATMSIIADSNNVLASTAEFEYPVYMLSAEWKCWESFEFASQTTAKASVYLITEPDTGIMVRFHLDQLGDLAYFHDAVPTSVPLLSFLGRFRTVN